MAEKHVDWFNRLNGGLWQSEVEHGGIPEKRESFERGENFDTTFGYPTKRCGYNRLNAAPPGSACIKSNFQKKARAHIQFGDKKLGGTPGEFLMGISFKVPDEFRLQVNQCAPILMRPGPTTVIGPTTFYHEFLLYLINVAGTPNIRLQVMTYASGAGTYENKTLSIAFPDATMFTTGGWHRVDFQYWVHTAVGHISAIVDGDIALYAQVDFTAAHYWLDTVGTATKYFHAGQVYIGGFPGTDWDKYLPVQGLIYDVEYAEFRYDEEAYYTGAVSSIEDVMAAATSDAWIKSRTTTADVVTHLDESGGMLLAGSGTEWELPGAITNSRPSWQPEGGLTMLGGTWRENPGLVILETGDGKTPLSSIFGPDSSQLLPEWTMHFRFVQPPYIGQDDYWNGTGGLYTYNIIASQGFIDLVTAANDQSPSGWTLAYRKAGAGWALMFSIRVSGVGTVLLLNIADPTAVAGEVWVTVRRASATLALNSTYGSTSGAFLATQTTQLDGTEPLVFGAQFATLEDYKNFRSSYPQAMLTLKEFRALPYAVNDERVASTDWRTAYQDPHRDYLALFQFREGQGTELVDFSNSRLRGRILESGVNETYLSSVGPPVLWAARRYGDLMPMSWTRGHPTVVMKTTGVFGTYSASPIDAVTMYHHPQLGETRVAIGDGHAWEINGTTLTDIAAEYGSIEVPKVGTLDYAQYGGRVYVADGSNRPQVLEAGRFRPAGLEAPPLQAKPGVLAYPGSDVTGYVTYMVAYENVEAGVISDGIVTDPVYLDHSGALVGWDAEAAAIQGIPCSECEGVLQRDDGGGAANVTTWFPTGATEFTWEGMVFFEGAQTGADNCMWEKDDNAAGPIIGAWAGNAGGVTQIKLYANTAAGYASRIGVPVPSFNVWHHYAWVYKAGVHRVYVDGRLYIERSESVPGTSITIVGNITGPLEFFNIATVANGRFQLAEWRFWNRSRTESEIENQFHVSLKSAGDANLIFNISPKSQATKIDEKYRHNVATGTDRDLDTDLIAWLGAPDYSLFKESRDKYAPLPLAKGLATHLRFYRSSPYALGATPTPAEVAEAKQAAQAGPWRYVGRAPIGDTYFVDRTYQDAEREQRGLAEVEPPPQGAYYVERFGAMMVYARTDRYPERLWVSKVWEPETIPTAAGWADVDDGTGEPITGLCASGDHLYVFKHSAIYAITGTEPSLLQMTLVSRGTGCVSNRSIVQAMGRVWLWTANGPGVLDGGQITNLAMPITAEVRYLRKMEPIHAATISYDSWIIGAFDPKRHRVGWLVQQSVDIDYLGEETSAILWFDYLYQVWSKHTWRHKIRPAAYYNAWPIQMVGFDCMFNESTGLHDICTVDNFGWIYHLDPNNITSELDCSNAHGTTPGSTRTATTSTDTITGIVGMTPGALVGIPVLLIYSQYYADGAYHDLDPWHPYYSEWDVVESNTATTITLENSSLIAGKTTWYLGAIDCFVEKAWSDGGAPMQDKVFESFYFRPTTYSQEWWAWLHVQRAMADYTTWSGLGGMPIFRAERIQGDGRFQVDLWERGTRLKWRLEAPIPDTSGSDTPYGIQEAGWTAKIMPGTPMPYDVGTGLPQDPYALGIWPVSTAPLDPGELGVITTVDDGAVPPAGEA